MSTCVKDRKALSGRSAGGNAALRYVLVLVVGAPLLSGCVASHVGNAWQCPLVQGQPCASVADADPAGAGARRGNTGTGLDTAVRTVPGLETPLYRTAPAARDRADDAAAQVSRRRCRGGCRPFAWLRRLGKHRTEGSPDAGVGAADTDAGDVSEPVAMAHTDISMAQDPAADDLRTPEVIGRIWIAPYVDALGVYHEASWVRVVFEPAGWKHP